MPRGWEGNRRSGVALAMRHRLQWFIKLSTYGLTAYTFVTSHLHEHHAYSVFVEYGLFTFTYHPRGHFGIARSIRLSVRPSVCPVAQLPRL